MRKNIYTKSLKHKSDKELEVIKNSSDHYVEEARIAAGWLLEERNGSYTNIETEQVKIKDSAQKPKIEIEPHVAEVVQKEPIIPKRKSYITDDPNAPELYSQKVIIGFSILFSTIFGAVLLMHNMKKTNNRDGRVLVIVFGIVWTMLTIVLLVLLNSTSTFPSLLFNFAGAGILIGYFWNKFIGKELPYRTKNWTKPAIISVILLSLYLWFIFSGGL